MEQNKKNQSILYTINLIIQFFIETFISVIIGYFIGKYIDLWLFDGKSIFLYIFIVLGVFAGLWNLIKRVLKNISEGEKNEKDKHN